MYSILSNISFINGTSGKYDNLVKNDSVRYGRNACNNYKTYINDLSTEKMPPIQFEYRYMPDGKINPYALIGNAYEELGQKVKVKTEDLNKQFETMPECSADALDINKDGYVDIAEYSTSTLVQDVLSKDDKFNIDPSKVTGIINNMGESKSFALNYKKNEDSARNIYQNLYNEFNLGKAQEEFLSDKNNIA